MSFIFFQVSPSIIPNLQSLCQYFSGPDVEPLTAPSFTDPSFPVILFNYSVLTYSVHVPATDFVFYKRPLFSFIDNSGWSVPEDGRQYNSLKTKDKKTSDQGNSSVYIKSTRFLLSIGWKEWSLTKSYRYTGLGLVTLHSFLDDPRNSL